MPAAGRNSHAEGIAEVGALTMAPLKLVFLSGNVSLVSRHEPNSWLMTVRHKHCLRVRAPACLLQSAMYPPLLLLVLVGVGGRTSSSWSLLGSEGVSWSSRWLGRISSTRTKLFSGCRHEFCSCFALLAGKVAVLQFSSYCWWFLSFWGDRLMQRF